MISPSDEYRQITEKKYLYNIMPVSNIPSVIHRGILSYDQVRLIQHQSVAMNEVQVRRDRVIIPKVERRLHSYANLYFTHHNPMMYKRKDQADELCILAIDSKIMNVPGCILTDQNAASSVARFYSPEEGLREINFDKVFAKYWTSSDYYEEKNNKRIKCAEVLIPDKIPFGFVCGAYVASNDRTSTSNSILGKGRTDGNMYSSERTLEVYR